MQNKVRKFLKEHNLKGKNALVGYSSGVDSTVLLHILNSLKEEFSLKSLTAVHLNHNWRGEFSDEDEKFAQNFCKNNDIDFYSEKLPPDIQKTETTAREKRYEFFENCKRKFNADVIFLAHTKDDNIETAIYRIIKGTGIEGLRSILPVRDIFYRPLLEISKEEIINYAKENNLEYREDNSNTDIKYRRNFIRHKILPLFKEINPTAEASISNLIKVAQAEYELIEEKMEEIKEKLFENGKIKTEEFSKLPKSHKMKIIQNYIKNDLKNPNSRKIEQIIDFIEETVKEKQDPQFRKWKKFSINSELFLYVNKKEIFKEK